MWEIALQSIVTCGLTISVSFGACALSRAQRY
jgi:hypothetical protein